MTTRSQERYERFERLMEAPMLVASGVFALLLLVPMFAELPDPWPDAIEAAMWLIWALFVFEFLGLLYLAPSRRHMLRTHVLDLIIVAVPFLRPLRLLRLIAAGSAIGRTSQALARITSRRGFRWYLGIVVLLIIAGGLLFYAAEHTHPDATLDDPTDGIWWAIVTTTTVGYGDYFPHTGEGRAIATVLMFLGISLISVVTANVASFLVHDEVDQREREVLDRLDRIEAMLSHYMDGTRANHDQPATTAALHSESAETN